MELTPEEIKTELIKHFTPSVIVQDRPDGMAITFQWAGTVVTIARSYTFYDLDSIKGAILQTILDYHRPLPSDPDDEMDDDA